MKRLVALALVLALTTGFIILLPAGEVLAGPSKTEICEGVSAVSGQSGCTGGTTDINRIIGIVLNLMSVVIGIIAVVMIMIGGFKYITAGGDSGNITSAKHTILYAVIGLIVVAMAQFIVQFVLDKAT